MKYLGLPLLLLFVGCNEPVKVLDLSKDCDEMTLMSKSVMSIDAIIEGNCEDISQYKCDVREFSPSLSTEVKKNVEYCPDESATCLRFDHYIFDTSEQKKIDEHASVEDFEKGGQYNRQEVKCWNQVKKTRSPASDSSSLKDALKAAYEICKQ
jgi:hypothetical protein